MKMPMPKSTKNQYDEQNMSVPNIKVMATENQCQISTLKITSNLPRLFKLKSYPGVNHVIKKI